MSSAISNDSHFHLFSLLIRNPHSLSFKLTVRNILYLVVMDQHRKDDFFSENGVDVDIPLRNTNNEGEKSNKCNQCDYASSQAGNLGRHLTTHIGEKTNKCKKCEFASSCADVSRAHFKTHSGEKRSVAPTSLVGGGPFAVGNEPARAPGFSTLPPLSLLSGDLRTLIGSPETLFGLI